VEESREEPNPEESRNEEQEVSDEDTQRIQVSSVGGEITSQDGSQDANVKHGGVTGDGDAAKMKESRAHG
jgi:hypothetical protein